MNIAITAPTLGDLDTLWKWGEENRQLWGDEVNKWFSKPSLTRWLDEPEDDILLVARDGNVPVGMCMTGVMRDWAFCFGLYVDAGYRGKGIGKLLLDETAGRLRLLGVESLSLLVEADNREALRFYERENFYKGYKFFFMTKLIKEVP